MDYDNSVIPAGKSHQLKIKIFSQIMYYSALGGSAGEKEHAYVLKAVQDEYETWMKEQTNIEIVDIDYKIEQLSAKPGVHNHWHPHAHCAIIIKYRS